MTDYFVTVTAQWTDGSSNVAEGNYEFVASGSLMDSGAVAIVTPMIYGTLDDTGSLSVSLLASDNFGNDPQATLSLTWHVKIVVQGVPLIEVADVPVNYAGGASQGLFTVLEAAGWVPTVV